MGHRCWTPRHKNHVDNHRSSTLNLAYGSFTLTETDSGSDPDSDPKLHGYIVLCRTFHTAQTWTQIPTPYCCEGRESQSESVPSLSPAMEMSHYGLITLTGTDSCTM